MKKAITLLTVCLASLTVSAQKKDSKDYAKMKEELNERIFGTPDPYFKSNTVPDEYKNESAVILAQKHSLESDSKYKFKFYLITAAGGTKYSFFETLREKVLINDKSALDEYSELNFTKLQSKTSSYLGKLKNYTFINIRLIKPNGTIRNIDVDESAVTLKDDKSGTKNKIAVPDLSVGDIIDYYVCNYYQEDGNSYTETPLTFALGDDHPVLNYIISLQFDAKIAVEYQAINGAPDFKISPDEDGGGNVLNLAVKNVPKIKGMIWSSAYRQLPIIRMHYKRGVISRRDMPDIKPGRVEKATKAYPDMIEANLAVVMNSVCYSGAVESRIYKAERADARDAWKAYIAKNPKADKPDSIPAFLFRYLNWKDYYGSFSLETNFNNAYFSNDLARQMYRIAKYGFILLQEFKTDLDFLVVPAKNSYARENLFSESDLSVMVRTKGAKPQYYSFADIFDFQNAIPYPLQGETAKVYPFRLKQVMGGKLLYVQLKESSTVTLPSSKHTDNAVVEKILVKPDAADFSLLTVSRKMTATGGLKKDAQASLTIFEEMALQTGMTIGEKDDLVTRYTRDSKTAKKQEGELQILLQKARAKHKEDFENEIERSYDLKAKEFKTYRILDYGTSAGQPFVFEEEFTMEGWVKKAGNNYIVDVGKFISGQIEIEKDQRDRKKDVYMPFPRSFSYNIELEIPEGYTLEGAEKLNVNVVNETGAFTSVARLEGNALKVDVDKYYNNFFEPVTRWPLLLDFLDKALEFNQLKVLLKKI